MPVMPSCDILLALPQGLLVKYLGRQYAYCGVLSVGTVRKASAEPVKQQGRHVACAHWPCCVLLCSVMLLLRITKHMQHAVTDSQVLKGLLAIAAQALARRPSQMASWHAGGSHTCNQSRTLFYASCPVLTGRLPLETSETVCGTPLPGNHGHSLFSRRLCRSNTSSQTGCIPQDWLASNPVPIVAHS